MGAGVLLALTIPGLAVLLVAPAAAGADVFSAVLVPGGAGDLDAGVAHLVLPPADLPAR